MLEITEIGLGFFFAQLASNALFICCEWGFPHERTLNSKYPQNLELFWTLTPHTFDYKYVYVHL